MPGLWSWSKITSDEYRANLTGMNTFFGAVIGFVLAEITTPNLASFAQLLLHTAAIVISILYVSASRHRWIYGAMTLLFIWLLPRLLEGDPSQAGRLQVTLATWTVMTILLEAALSWQNRREAKRIDTAA